MRLLPIGTDYGRDGAAEAQPQSHRCRYRSGDDEYLPLRHLSRYSKRDSQSRRPHGGEVSAMELDRREFIVATAVVSGGFGLLLMGPAETAPTAPFPRGKRTPWLAPGPTGGARRARGLGGPPD